LCFKKKKQIHL